MCIRDLREAHFHPSHPDYVPSIFPDAYNKDTWLDKRRAERHFERSIQQKERKLIAVERQCQEEDVRYKNEVREEVMGRMDYLRAEGERIQMD